MKRYPSACLPLLPLFLILGCKAEPNTPTNEQARVAVASALAEYGPLQDFRKTNGEQQTRSDQPFYIFHYRAAVKLPAGYRWFASWMGSAELVRADQDYGIGERTDLPEGTTYIVEGSATFRFTEKGWVLEDESISSTGYCQSLEPVACYGAVWPPGATGG